MSLRAAHEIASHHEHRGRNWLGLVPHLRSVG